MRLADIDRLRCTRALADQALDILGWLGLRWEEPVRRQSRHLGDYGAAQEELERRGLLYPCFCTRSEIARDARGAWRDPGGNRLDILPTLKFDETPERASFPRNGPAPPEGTNRCARPA